MTSPFRAAPWARRAPLGNCFPTYLDRSRPSSRQYAYQYGPWGHFVHPSRPQRTRSSWNVTFPRRAGSGTSTPCRDTRRPRAKIRRRRRSCSSIERTRRMRSRSSVILGISVPKTGGWWVSLKASPEEWPSCCRGEGPPASGRRDGQGRGGRAFVQAPPAIRCRDGVGVGDAQVEEVRVTLGHEIADPQDPLPISERGRGHGRLLAPELPALPHTGEDRSHPCDSQPCDSLAFRRLG